MSDTLPEETFSLLRKDFDFPDHVVDFDEESAISMLTKVIAHMLDRQFERLLQICYRIDLGEDQLKRILHESKPDQVAVDLAKALWYRQKQKIAIRKRYSSNE